MSSEEWTPPGNPPDAGNDFNKESSTSRPEPVLPLPPTPETPHWTREEADALRKNLATLVPVQGPGIDGSIREEVDREAFERMSARLNLIDRAMYDNKVRLERDFRNARGIEKET